MIKFEFYQDPIITLTLLDLLKVNAVLEYTFNNLFLNSDASQY